MTKKKREETKKKSKASSTALAVRDKTAGTSTAALVRANAESTAQLIKSNEILSQRVNNLESALLKFVDRQNHAPPPLFELDVSVYYLADHDVMLVAVDINNNGAGDLTINSVQLEVGGERAPEMNEQYKTDVELSGRPWSGAREQVLPGCVLELAWGFESNGGGVGSNATLRLRIGGVEILENHVVGAFVADAPPTRREAPKQLAAPAREPQFGVAGAKFDAGAPGIVSMTESLWRGPGKG